MDEPTIRRGRDGDRAGIKALLTSHRLPVPAPGDTPVRFVVAASGHELVGTVGWEIHDREVLMRSVAVAASGRGGGTGSRLVTEALRRIDADGFRRITLVTLDADAFFARFAFVPIAREDVPAPLRSSTEFRVHECAGGQWMQRDRDL